MNILKSISGSVSGWYARQFEARKLAADASHKEKVKRYLDYVAKAVSRTRQDIASWKRALDMTNSDDPRNFALQLLFDDVEIDALLTSQMENRIELALARPFELVKEDGTVDEEATKALANMAGTRALTHNMLEAIYYGYSLIELDLSIDVSGKLVFLVKPIPRTNVVPQKGFFYSDYTDDKKVAYREMNEFGTWILEFDTTKRGLINKAVPHVLFRRFAQSCWSEFCEIFGIPPRVLSTNTQDANMLRRAEKMMGEMGAAAWFIIDETEKLNFATGTASDGAVYDNLIKLCSNEISMLISGAILGQDTKNGNRSKEEVSQGILQFKVNSDLLKATDWWNSIALPALSQIGMVSPGLRLKFEGTEDLEQLWKFTKESFDYFDVDPEWIKSKFGVQVTGKRGASDGPFV